MSSGRRSWSLCSLLTLLGGSLGVHVTVHQKLVNGTVGHSVLLPVSYTLVDACCFPLAIAWTLSTPLDTLISCTVTSCTLAAGGVPSNCSSRCFPMPPRRDIQFFPNNGSLLLRNLQLRDSGVYNVTFRSSSQTWNLTLAVHENPLSPEPPDPRQQGHVYYYTAGVCSSLALVLVLLLSCCLWHRGAARQQKWRNKERQQQQEAHMESIEAMDIVTIYSTIGSHPGTAPRPRTAPGRPGQDTEPYSLLI
ncbi:uncharacterized protein [Melanerpes formicivorus]|uniref:uncharacterized protein isoform X2 n=1 Tax=Melanerpes formicivorus TaxID=211600 RepID=UPI00358F38D5